MIAAVLVALLPLLAAAAAPQEVLVKVGRAWVGGWVGAGRCCLPRRAAPARPPLAPRAAQS